ncbi:hypothetical protein VTK73DRAFT_1148 [Phialemonium thermophilum]|uniref:Uncharacterized protein n=1 Tax=Phialemonium thermophilum TaxID=223376 RepID=A0ABR3VTV9_9PEZI
MMGTSTRQVGAGTAQGYAEKEIPRDHGESPRCSKSRLQGFCQGTHRRIPSEHGPTEGARCTRVQLTGGAGGTELPPGKDPSLFTMQMVTCYSVLFRLSIPIREIPLLLGCGTACCPFSWLRMLCRLSHFVPSARGCQTEHEDKMAIGKPHGERSLYVLWKRVRLYCGIEHSSTYAT